MKPGLSIWLDLIRVVATVVVVLSHWAYPRFTDGTYVVLREWNIGSDAVIVFFVISGIVIAYAAGRDQTAGRFAFNRLTRLWSVLIPAIFLTFLFDRLGIGLDPSAYPQQYFQPLNLWEMLGRGLTFSNEFAFPGPARLGTNGPLWSLSYEAAYYAIFGAAAFLAGARRIAVLLVLIMIAGPRIILLMPAWLMGVWFWHRLFSGSLPVLKPASAFLLSIGAPALYVICQAINLPDQLSTLTADALGLPDARQMLRFSDEFIWNMMIGIFTTLHLIGMAHLLHNRRLNWTSVRWFAGASFSIYVTHYPALHLLDASLPSNILGRHAILLLGAIAVGLVFAELFERRLGILRSALRGSRRYAVRS